MATAPVELPMVPQLDGHRHQLLGLPPLAGHLGMTLGYELLGGLGLPPSSSGGMDGFHSVPCHGQLPPPHHPSHPHLQHTSSGLPSHPLNNHRTLSLSGPTALSRSSSAALGGGEGQLQVAAEPAGGMADSEAAVATAAMPAACGEQGARFLDLSMLGGLQHMHSMEARQARYNDLGVFGCGPAGLGFGLGLGLGLVPQQGLGLDQPLPSYVIGRMKRQRSQDDECGGDGGREQDFGGAFGGRGAHLPTSTPFLPLHLHLHPQAQMPVPPHCQPITSPEGVPGHYHALHLHQHHQLLQQQDEEQEEGKRDGLPEAAEQQQQQQQQSYALHHQLQLQMQGSSGMDMAGFGVGVGMGVGGELGLLAGMQLHAGHAGQLGQATVEQEVEAGSSAGQHAAPHGNGSRLGAEPLQGQGRSAGGDGLLGGSRRGGEEEEAEGMHEGEAEGEGEGEGQQARGQQRKAPRRRRVGTGGEKAKSAAARSSKFRGVTKHRRSGRYEAHIWVKELGRQVYLGGYEQEEHAAEAYDIAALKCKGRRVKTNFSLDKYEDLLGCIGRMSMEELVMAVRRQSQGFSRGTSSFRGVTHHPSGRWEARIGVPGSKHIYLGLFQQEEEAARAYDRALVRLRGRNAATNFGLGEYRGEMADFHAMQNRMLRADARFDEIQSTPALFERWIKGGWESFPELASPAADGGAAAAAAAAGSGELREDGEGEGEGEWKEEGMDAELAMAAVPAGTMPGLGCRQEQMGDAGHHQQQQQQQKQAPQAQVLEGQAACAAAAAAVAAAATAAAGGDGSDDGDGGASQGQQQQQQQQQQQAEADAEAADPAGICFWLE